LTPNMVVFARERPCEADMAALLAGAGRLAEEPLALLLPIRQASLFRCLHGGRPATG
jgi:hypothetical protein